MNSGLSHLALPMASTPEAAATSTADATVDVVAIGADAVAAPAAADATATIEPRTDALPQVAHKTTAFAQVGAPSPMPQASSSAGSIGGALFALVLVIGLILLLGWLAKRMPGFGGTRSNAALRVVGSLALGPRERVVVVAVGDTQLLLGVGSGGTRTLHTLETPLPLPAETKTTPAFAQLLAQHFGKKP